MPHLQAMTWDFQDQLRVVELSGGKAYYNYDGSGQRIRKVIERNGSKKSERLYLGGVERYQEYNNNGVVTLERWTLEVEDIAQVDTLTIDNSLMVVNPVALIRYQYKDHLGSASLETNETGQVISYEEYHPFGTSAYRTAKSGTDLSLKCYRFTNKERDDETGLYYFGVRYYAAWLGRWTSSDPGDFVDGLNLYVYVRNNPVNGVDELGYETDPPKYTQVNQTENGGTLYKDNTYKNAFKLVTESGGEYYRNTEGRYWAKMDGQWVEQSVGMMKETGVHQILAGMSSGASTSSNQVSRTVPETIPQEGGGSELETIGTGSFIGDLLVGEIPFVGTGVDLANAGIEFSNGNYVMAGLNAAAAIPLLGLLFGSLAKSMKVAKAIDKAVDATDLGKYGDNLDETVTFYHGTTKQGAEAIKKNGVDVSRSTHSKDFGAGFYTSTNYDLAKRSPVNRVPGVSNIDDVHVIKFDIPKFELDNLTSLRLKPNTQDFSDFARFHKTHGPTTLQHGGRLYDMVTGPLVSRISNKTNTVKHFEKFYGISPSIQTSFHTKSSQRLLNIYMRF